MLQKDYEPLGHIRIHKCPENCDEKCARVFRWKSTKGIICLCMCIHHSNIDNPKENSSIDKSTVQGSTELGYVSS
ncbi:MAG: hypothetical protein AB7F53_01755 [Nitrososphaeraceae archaeon]